MRDFVFPSNCPKKECLNTEQKKGEKLLTRPTSDMNNNGLQHSNLLKDCIITREYAHGLINASLWHFQKKEAQYLYTRASEKLRYLTVSIATAPSEWLVSKKKKYKTWCGESFLLDV